MTYQTRKEVEEEVKGRFNWTAVFNEDTALIMADFIHAIRMRDLEAFEEMVGWLYGRIEDKESLVLCMTLLRQIKSLKQTV